MRQQAETISHANWYVYKITFPNGKIYIGIDYSEQACPWQYLGSSSNKQLQIDCHHFRQQHKQWVIKQEILFESTTCTKAQLRQIEHEKILYYQATNPDIGYNLRS